MSKSRNQLALEIQEGASNPYAIVHCLMDAIREAREGGDPCNDPACRLIVHQLSHLFAIHEVQNSLDLYGKLAEHCREVMLPPLPRITQASIEGMTRIQNLLSGEEWDVGVLDDIAEVLNYSGYPVADVDGEQP